MPLDPNRSTIDKLKKVYSYDENLTNRTVSKIPFFIGLTFGDVIRYDITTSGYTRSQANTSINSEVFGIIENLDPDGVFNVVTNGSITLSSSRLINNNQPNIGRNDIYFLSGLSAGYLCNAGATGINNIIKPLYYNSPHGKYTGLVRNYIGFKNGVNQ